MTNTFVRKRSFKKAGEPVKAGALLGYGRVFEDDERTNALQARALRKAGCRRLFEEATSGGGSWHRPELHRMFDELQEGDTVVVWKLDRLSRSLKSALHIIDRIGQAGAGFRSLSEGVDTTTPAGQMLMQMIGAFAEYERTMLRERTSDGLVAARAEGRIGGRRNKLDAAERRKLAESVLSGQQSPDEAARLYAVGRTTVYRIIALHRRENGMYPA